MESINQIKLRADMVRRKSKKLLAFTIMTLAASALATTVKAQTFAEWFKQKSTQKKYLLQQIAALEVYASYYKIGNNIARNGLGSITGYLTSENGLHSTYYNNLKAVNPLVRNNKKVADIIQWQQDILIRIANIDKTSNLTTNEKKYITRVKGALLKDCDGQIAELEAVVTNGQLQMSDEERLRRIGTIHTSMQNNYRFASAFSGQVRVFAIQRVREIKNVNGEMKIYGIK